MEFNEQEKGIFIGVILTVMFVYIFNFLFPSQDSSKLDLQKEEIQQTQADRFLNEPLGLYTGVERIDEDESQRKNTLKRKRKRRSRKKIAARKGRNNNKRDVKRNKVKNDEKKEDEDKKAEDEEAEEEKNENINVADNDPYTAENRENNESISGISGSLYPNAAATEDNNNTHEFDTVEEWLVYFINAQSLSSIDKFTNAYLSKEISGTLFYAVIEDLLINFRESLNHYGLIALDKVPSSESFEHLVHISEDADHPHPPNVQSRAKGSLKTYTNFSYIDILSETLDSSKDNVRLKTIDVVQTSAQVNLRSNDQLSNGESRQRVLPSGIGGSRKIIYDSVKIKLESIAQKDVNSTVRIQASQAANVIGDLLQKLNKPQ